MSMIRETILKRMQELGITSYQVCKRVEGDIPQRTVYAFLSGEKDTSTKNASIIMEALDLSITIIQPRKRG